LCVIIPGSSNAVVVYMNSSNVTFLGIPENIDNDFLD